MIRKEKNQIYLKLNTLLLLLAALNEGKHLNLTSIYLTKKAFIKIFHREWSEFAENLRFCFEKLLCSENYSKSQILIIVSVLESDGSTKSAIFNAVSLALIDAGFL